MGIQQEPQAPYSQPQQIPPQKPKRGIFKMKRTWVAIAAILIILLIVVVNVGRGNSTTTGISSNTATTQRQPTTAPTKAPQWVTTHTFTGDGGKKTAVFTVGDDWRISWSCDPTSFQGTQFNLIIMVYNSDGTISDPAAVNTICKAGNTHDVTEEHQGGDVYLDINSEGAWKVQIQELK